MIIWWIKNKCTPISESHIHVSHTNFSGKKRGGNRRSLKRLLWFKKLIKERLVGPVGGWAQTLYLTSKPFVKITTKGGREVRKKRTLIKEFGPPQRHWTCSLWNVFNLWVMNFSIFQYWLCNVLQYIGVF